MSEEKLQIAICRYIAHQYPDVIFHCDLASGMKLTIGQAVKAKKMRASKGYPDLFIAEPRGTYAGLFLELKKEGSNIYKKDGQLRKSDHLIRQSEMLQYLTKKGYYACFAVGFDYTKKVIDWYLNE